MTGIVIPKRVERPAPFTGLVVVRCAARARRPSSRARAVDLAQDRARATRPPAPTCAAVEAPHVRACCAAMVSRAVAQLLRPGRAPARARWRSAAARAATSRSARRARQRCRRGTPPALTAPARPARAQRAAGAAGRSSPGLRGGHGTAAPRPAPRRRAADDGGDGRGRRPPCGTVPLHADGQRMLAVLRSCATSGKTSVELGRVLQQRHEQSIAVLVRARVRRRSSSDRPARLRARARCAARRTPSGSTSSSARRGASRRTRAGPRGP